MVGESGRLLKCVPADRPGRWLVLPFVVGWKSEMVRGGGWERWWDRNDVGDGMVLEVSFIWDIYISVKLATNLVFSRPQLEF